MSANLIDHRYAFKCKSNNKYFITIKFGTVKKQYETVDIIIRNANNKQRIFESNYNVKEFLSENRHYTIKKLPKSISNKLLLTPKDVKNDIRLDDIEEIKKHFIKHYQTEYNKDISNANIKLNYDGLISCGINRFKENVTVVLHPDLKNKLSRSKMTKHFTKNNKNPNVELKVYFQYGKYKPKEKKQIENKVQKIELDNDKNKVQKSELDNEIKELIDA